MAKSILKANHYLIQSDDGKYVIYMTLFDDYSMTITNTSGQPFKFNRSKLEVIKNIAELLLKAVEVAVKFSDERGLRRADND